MYLIINQKRKNQKLNTIKNLKKRKKKSLLKKKIATIHTSQTFITRITNSTSVPINQSIIANSITCSTNFCASKQSFSQLKTETTST